MDSKKWVPLSIYLSPELYSEVERLAEVLCGTKAGACELLIKRGLGRVGDAQVEEIIREAQERKARNE